MKRSLLWISLLLSVAFAPSAVRSQIAESPSGVVFDQAGGARYALIIRTRGAELTGICVMKRGEEGIVGSVVNEFGIKAFDFVYTSARGRVKLRNVVSFLDKWYIRKAVQGDLGYLLSSPRKRSRTKTISVDRQQTLRLENKRHKISYQFTPLIQIESEI
jgi:hypothetical protein